MVLKTLYNSVMDVISPCVCVTCGELITPDNKYYDYLCQKCYYSFQVAPSTEKVLTELLRDISLHELALNRFHCMFTYDHESAFGKLIHKLKYSGFEKIGFDFGKELGSWIAANHSDLYDYIIPVPIHNARFRERFYNQSEKIARGLAVTLLSNVNSTIVKRSRYTVSQTYFNAEKRRQNVKDVFIVAKPELIKNKRILLTDDVITTGSTINSCAMALLEAGARTIDAAVLGHA